MSRSEALLVLAHLLVGVSYVGAEEREKVVVELERYVKGDNRDKNRGIANYFLVPSYWSLTRRVYGYKCVVAKGLQGRRDRMSWQRGILR